ncbi:MAG TPA: NADH-quinone oxidoreductase subunit N [Candidatus Korarchaeota archaeon]|nr:NADH-quinone oxidoreductase subunit N [Candidatus Korarchaeota archaeon]
MIEPTLILKSILILLSVPGLLVPLLDHRRESRRKLGFSICVLCLLTTLTLSAQLLLNLSGSVYAFNDSLRLDAYSAYLAMLVTFGALLVAIASYSEMVQWTTALSSYSLMMLALAGVYVMLFVNDASVLLGAWALVAVASYVLAGIKKDLSSTQGAAKYGIMGAASSSLLVYGLALVLGIAGSSQLVFNMDFTAVNEILFLGTILLISAFGFKLGVFPFHGWLPDVYGGIHPLLVSYIAGVVKMVGIAGLLRVVVPLHGVLGDSWLLTMAVFSLATMTFGNLVALLQKDVQRMMAYSSIAHAGYILIGFSVIAGPESEVAYQGIALHLTTYVLAKIGIFVSLAYMARKGLDLSLEGLSGVGRKMPAISASLSTLVLSLMGFPPLLGFWSKFMYLFLSATDLAPWLALAGVLNSGISVGYYAQVIRYIYFRKPVEEIEEKKADPEVLVAIITALLTIILGLGPFSLILSII